MKKCLLTTSLFLFGIVMTVDAQFREDLVNSSNYTGAVIQANHPSTSLSASNLMDMLNMSMSHSYSMNFSSIGGQYQNLNAYTNHMTFDISEDLTGHLDVSFLHSPFGNSYMTMNSSNSFGNRILIDRAQLDYKISDNTRLSIQFSQRPYYSPFGHYPGSFTGRNHFGY